MDLRNFNVSIFFVRCINTQDDHARPTPSIFNTMMRYNNNNNNNNKLQLGCHPVGVVILHVHKYEISN